jgi:hypothetical protein
MISLLRSKAAHLAAIVDLETTGWNASVDEIIEAAVLLFEFDPVSATVLGKEDFYSGLREESAFTRLRVTSTESHLKSSGDTRLI